LELEIFPIDWSQWCWACLFNVKVPCQENSQQGRLKYSLNQLGFQENPAMMPLWMPQQVGSLPSYKSTFKMLSLRDLLNHQQLSQPAAPMSSSLFPGDDHTKKKKAVAMPFEIQYMKIAELTHSKLEIALKNVKLGQSRDKRV
jgi:hypothetical protein